MSASAVKCRKGGALHRRGPAVFYAPTGDPLRDAWNAGELKQKPSLLATKRKSSLTKNRLSKSKLKLYYEIWKDSLAVDAAGNVVEKEDKEEEESDGKEEKEKGAEGVRPELQYSRDELIELQKTPLSQIKPTVLINFPIEAKNSFVKGVYWEKEVGKGGAAPQRDRWSNEHDVMRRGDSRGDNNRMSRDSRGKEGQSDPSYILSPQRRSFNNGCYMTGGNRDKVMDRESMGVPAQGRRFGERGGGRSIPWSDSSSGGPESTTFVAPNLMPDYTQRRDAPPPLSQVGGGSLFERTRGYDNTNKYENSKFENKRLNNRNGGDYNGRSNGDYHRNSGDYNRNGDYNNRNNDYGGNNRYGMNNDRRQRNNSERNHGQNDIWDEPEWFAEPTTQNDVIELRGFLDDDRDESSPEKNRKSSSNSTSESERGLRKSSSSSSGGLDKLEDARPPSAGKEKSSPSPSGATTVGAGLKFGPGEPNLDDLLNNLDTLPELISNDSAASGMDSSGGGSRFSRWFRKESPAPENQSPSHHMIHDLINEVTDENRPPNSNRFSPISPVFANQNKPLHSNSTSNFLDMMMKGQEGAGGMRSGSVRDLEGVGKLHSVEELEAKLRPKQNSHPHAGNKEEDMANFKKLMMSKLLQQQALAANLHQGGHQLPPGVGGPWGNVLAAQSNNNYQELMHKIVKLQQAQEYHRRMASLGLSNNLPTPGIPPELQHHLLNNPQFDARNLVRLFQQRIPSPSQLAAHSQTLLTNAIIKRKIEEQKEVLRKHQLLQRAVSPGNVHHHAQPGNLIQHGTAMGSNMIGSHGHAAPGGDPRPSQASPVINAFTPTSVLRKMTAHPQEQPEKDMLLNQNHSQGQVPGQLHWSKQQGPTSLAHKTHVINLGNQQISGQASLQMPNPRSKFTLSSKMAPKSSGQLQSLADQMNLMSQEMNNLKSPAQHTGNPFTSHHSQAGGPQGMESLQKWFSPEMLARSQSQAPLPSQNFLSVEELERLAGRGPVGNPSPSPGPAAPIKN